MRKHTAKQSGFTLVELAIVLTIIGLLAGGVLLGQDLIRGAQMQSISAGFGRYETAVKQFQKQYMALPGDLDTAHEIWGSADSGDGQGNDCGAIDSTTLANPQQTCSGNGNGFISGGGSYSANWLYTERFRAWQHMSNAGFIEGTFSGNTASASASFWLAPGRNVPRAEFDAIGYDITTYSATAANDHLFITGGVGSFNYATVIAVQSNGSVPVLMPAEALGIDEKLDDGRPGTGRMQTMRNTTSHVNYQGCANSDDRSVAVYNANIDEPRCWLGYALQQQ